MLNKSRGFTLIEVLVTLVILLFGLLGLAGLIVMGHRASFEAYQRHQALTIANELAERIKANQAMIAGTPANLIIADAYAAGAPLPAPLGEPANPDKWLALTVTKTTPDCGAVSCTRQDLVEYDLGVWEGQLLGVSEVRVSDVSNIGGIINARGCVEGPLVPTPATPSPPPNTYRVSVSWQGDVPTWAPASSACGTGLYRNAATGLVDDATRRVVSIDVTILVPPP